MLKAVLFDMDGVIVQTENLKARAHQETVLHFGGDVSIDVYKSVIGKSHDIVRDTFLHTAGILVDPKQYLSIYSQKYNQLLNTQICISPGIDTLVRHLHAQSIYLAVVSSSSRHFMLKILEMTGLTDNFDVLVSADEIIHKKPAPDPYLKALSLLNIRSDEAIVFEDTDAGIQAATSAGIQTIAVRHDLNELQVFSKAITVLNSLKDTDSISNLLFCLGNK